jgi:O-antigen/teichoic acid export membrane protein
MTQTSSQSDGTDYLQTDDLQHGLAGRTARGGAITIVSQGVKFGISLIATVILARLLTPEDYGLVGMVAAVTGFIAIFKDLGLSAATIQKAELNAGQVATLFWVNVSFSFGLMLVTAALAPAIAWFYAEPRLVWLTLAFAAGFMFGGLTVQHEALLRRRMRFGALAVAELVSLIASISAAICLAWLGARYWALAGAQLLQGVTYAAVIWMTCRWRPGLPTRGSGVRPLLAFGRNLTGFSIVNYFARNLDNILIGRYWGSTQLGLYARAYQLLLLPIDQINAPIASVAVPALSRLADSPERYRKAYLRLVEKVALLTMPLMAFMIASCDWIVLIVLGNKWVGVIRIFALLGIVGFVQPVCSTTGWLFVTQNRTHHMFQWGIIAGSIIIASILAGLPWGAIGVATSYSIVFLCVVAPLLFWFVGRHGPVRTTDIYGAIAPSLFAALTSLSVLMIFRWQISMTNPVIGLVLSFTVTFLCTLLCLASLPAGRRLLQDVRTLAQYLVRGNIASAI